MSILVSTATDGTDYEEINLTDSPLINQFGQNNRFECFNLTITDDDSLEFAEEFTVRAVVATPDVRVQLQPNTTIVTIMDNDGRSSPFVLQGNGRTNTNLRN